MATYGCKARRYGDEMQCNSCRMVWAVDDPHPPTCRNAAPVEQQPRQENRYKQAKGGE